MLLYTPGANPKHGAVRSNPGQKTLGKTRCVSARWIDRLADRCLFQDQNGKDRGYAGEMDVLL